ncbi:unnamed protein product [Brachionus calyciflorus]|uniref:Uncharacterized protein n=1 Tax=Brachionus calyciflorus TaxID=104777 RepID=A0A814DL07_9BILA|nr:unnamed protein product [Brachionus calyciflorus]
MRVDRIYENDRDLNEGINDENDHYEKESCELEYESNSCNEDGFEERFYNNTCALPSPNSSSMENNGDSRVPINGTPVYELENKKEIEYQNKNAKEVFLEYVQYFNDDGTTITRPRIDGLPPVEAKTALETVPIPSDLF